MQTFGIGKIVRNLKFEKVQGFTLSSLFITLVIVRLWGKTVASATSNNIQKLCNVSKNTLYRALLNERFNWRMFSKHPMQAVLESFQYGLHGMLTNET